MKLGWKMCWVAAGLALVWSAAAEGLASRTVTIKLPAHVTSDRMQFSYDEGVAVLNGAVRLDTVELKFTGDVSAADAKRPPAGLTFAGPVAVERTALHIEADKVTVFIETNRLAQTFVATKEKRPSAGATKTLADKAADLRERMAMIDSLTAEGSVLLTNKVHKGELAAALGTEQLRQALAGRVPELPFADERHLKDLQAAACTKAVYIGSTRKVVLHGDEAAGVPARLTSGAQENELKGRLITFWLDPVVIKGKPVDGKPGEEKLKLLPTQVDVDQSDARIGTAGKGK